MTHVCLCVSTWLGCEKDKAKAFLLQWESFLLYGVVTDF